MGKTFPSADNLTRLALKTIHRCLSVPGAKHAEWKSGQSRCKSTVNIGYYGSEFKIIGLNKIESVGTITRQRAFRVTMLWKESETQKKSPLETFLQVNADLKYSTGDSSNNIVF